MNIARRHSDEFKQEAVRIALISGLTRQQVASVMARLRMTQELKELGLSVEL